MAKNPLLVLSSALIVGLWAGAQLVTIPYVVNLLVLVTAILYVACHSSLILREEQALSRGELPPGDDGTSSESVAAPPSETLRKEGGCLYTKICALKLLHSLKLPFVINCLTIRRTYIMHLVT